MLAIERLRRRLEETRSNRKSRLLSEDLLLFDIMLQIAEDLNEIKLATTRPLRGVKRRHPDPNVQYTNIIKPIKDFYHSTSNENPVVEKKSRPAPPPPADDEVPF